jgi:hypothetical protein
MHAAKDSAQSYDPQGFTTRVRSAVAEVVRKQIDCGLAIINDGEAGKSNFSRYARERLSGFVERQARPEEQVSTIFARDMADFGDYFRKRLGAVPEKTLSGFSATVRSSMSAMKSCNRRSKISNSRFEEFNTKMLENRNLLAPLRRCKKTSS